MCYRFLESGNLQITFPEHLFILFSSSSFWLPVFHASKLAEQRRVIAYDFDGHGHKSDFSGTTSIDSLVTDLKDVLDGLSIQKAVLLGHSMSGVSILSYYSGNPCP